MGFVTTSTAMARKMGYKTPKFCKIVDWRLAITNLALQVLITFYVLYALIRGKTYLQTEVPIGKVTNWGNGNDVFSKVQATSLVETTTSVQNVTEGDETVETTILGCKTPSELAGYKFYYQDAAWEYTNVKCAYLTPDELITKETTGGMFITTHVTETITKRVPGMSGAGSCTDTSLGANTARSDDPLNGVCYYDKVTDWLAIGAEHTSIGISHEYDTLIAGKAGSNPKTYVRRAGSSENLHVFEAGKSISLKLKEILDVAQVDLDKRYEDQTPLAGDDVSSLYGTAGTSDAARTPMARLAGVRLKAQIRYYNYNLEDASSEETGSDEPYAILEIEPSFTWTSKGQKISYRTPSTATDVNDPIDITTNIGQPKGTLLNMYAYGVHIDITSSGMIGSINYVYLMNVLVSGLVMLKLAGTICDLIAMYGLGTRSLIYSNHMLEEANFVKESAKYAVQGMMAVNSFQAADQSGSGNLDIDELYELLSVAFHADDGMSINEKGGVDKAVRNRLSLKECREMARYIMAAGDREAQERFAKGLPPMSYEELKAERIDLEEWIELCTEGPMDIPTLKKVIAMDNEEQEAQRKLREMFGE